MKDIDLDSLSARIINNYEDVIFLAGFDEALIGVASRFGMSDVTCYSYEKCIEILMRAMTYE